MKGRWPCWGHRGQRPVGYWCLSGIHPQRPSILMDSHQLAAKHDQWWQDRVICWAKSGCRNTVVGLLFSHFLLFLIISHSSHLSVHFCPFTPHPTICAFLCLAGKWLRMGQQQWHVCHKHAAWTDGAAWSVWQITLLVVRLKSMPTAAHPSTSPTALCGCSVNVRAHTRGTQMEVQLWGKY